MLLKYCFVAVSIVILKYRKLFIRCYIDSG
nr:MAG TPA: hypothetical protein [Bacteriophage sp.]